MPKLVKNKQPAGKPKAKRPSSDPNLRAHELMRAMEAKQLLSGETITPPHGDPFEAQFKARMAELGRKGGKVSGAKRMEMPAKKRRDIAMKAAKARWAKKTTSGV